MRLLTERQRDILDFILNMIGQEGRFPSYREIGAHFGLTSPATVSQHLEALAAKGALERRGRFYAPVQALRSDRGMPIVGRVAAGMPITAVENIEDQIRWGELGGEGAFAVRVVGDSMIGDGIQEGDLAIVRPSEEADSGDLVVAYVGEEHEVTVKRYHQNREGVELRPSNPAYKPIQFSSKDPGLKIAGRVIAILRRY